MKKKNTLQLALIIVFSLVFIFFAYLIIREGLLIGRQTAEINSIEFLIGEKQAVLQKMKDAETRSAGLESQITILQKLIPEEPGQNHFLVWIHQISTEASLKLSNVSFGETVKKEGYAEMPVSLSVQGSFKSLLKFLSNLMYNERLVRVDDIDLTDSGGSLSIEIKANLFSKLPSEG